MCNLIIVACFVRASVGLLMRATGFCADCRGQSHFKTRFGEEISMNGFSSQAVEAYRACDLPLISNTGHLDAA